MGRDAMQRVVDGVHPAAASALGRLANNAAGADVRDMAGRTMQHLVDVAHNTDRANQTRAPLEDYRTVNGLNSLAPAIGSGINHSVTAWRTPPTPAWSEQVFEANHYDNLRHEVRTNQERQTHADHARAVIHGLHGVANLGKKPRRAPRRKA